jgi:hypothetical protein
MTARPFAHGDFKPGRQVGFVKACKSRGSEFQDARYREGDSSTGYRATFAGGTYTVAAGTHAGESGRIVSHEPGSGIFTTNGPAVSVGDYVWLRGPLVESAVPDPMPGERELGIGDFRVETSPGVSVDMRDEQIAIEVSGRDAYASIKHYLIALPSSNYRVQVRARAASGDGQLGVRLTNLGIPGGQPGNRISFACPDTALQPEWTEYTFTGATFDDERIRDHFSMLEVRVTGSGGGRVSAQLDSIELIDESIDSGFAFSQRLADTVAEAKCGVLRFYGIAGMGNLVEDITAKTAAASTWTFTDGPGGFQRHTTHAVLDDWLSLASKTGAAPWLTIGGANTPADWHSLISYLAAPADFDAASQKRSTNGRAEPWIDAFDTVYLELGNEWWNGIFAPFVIDDPGDYAALVDLVFGRVRAHPHFDAEKVRLVAGGWAINGRDWNVKLKDTAVHYDEITVAPYLAHELDGPDYPALFSDVEASYERNKTWLRNPMNLSVYELNTHTLGGAITPAQVSELAPSLAAGLAVLDQAMSCMANWRADPVNYFTYFQRSFGSGDQERVGLWGNFVLARDGTHRPRPIWQGLRLANRHVIEGDMVAVHVTGAESRNRGNVPWVKAYAFLKPGGQANVLLFNRHPTEERPVQIAIPFERVAAIEQVRLHSTALTDNNEEYERVKLVEESVDAVRRSFTLPPHSATALQFRAAE